MKKHSKAHGDRTTDFLRGGAHELASQVLKLLTIDDPDRYAGLALKIDYTYNPSYLDSILIGLGESESDFDPELVYSAIRHAAAVDPQNRWLGYALKRLYSAAIHQDIVEMLIDGATTPGASQAEMGGDLHMNAINGARGGNAHTLAILISTDDTGARAAQVAPHVPALIANANTAELTTVAQVIHTLLPWRRDAALAGYLTLSETTDTALFITRQFEGLAGAIVLADAETALPLIHKLRVDSDDDVREHGARLATLAATDADQGELLPALVSSTDAATRRGTAGVLADRVRWVRTDTVHDALVKLLNDEDETVRNAAGRFIVNLRSADLAPYKTLIESFIDSPALQGEIPQLTITLDRATGDIVDLVLRLAQRFLNLFDEQIGNIQTRAAGDAREIGDLVLRSYAQVGDPARRGGILDVVDRLLEVNTYGFNEAVDAAER